MESQTCVTSKCHVTEKPLLRLLESSIIPLLWFNQTENAVKIPYTGMDTTSLYNQLLAVYLGGSTVSTDNYVPLFCAETQSNAFTLLRNT